MSEAGLRRPAQIVELVGPPGAGKTSLFSALVGAAGVEGRPTLRGNADRLTVARAAADAAATLARRRAADRNLAEQVRMMAYLRTLPRVLDAADPAPGTTLVFDQGPVYLLSRTRLRHPRLRSWWRETLDRWALLLDRVVVLDAPDGVLAERIDSRASWHRVKGAPRDRALEVIASTRALYAEPLAALGAHAHGPLVVRYDTSRHSIAEIVGDILRANADVRVGASGRPAVEHDGEGTTGPPARRADAPA